MYNWDVEAPNHQLTPLSVGGWVGVHQGQCPLKHRLRGPSNRGRRRSAYPKVPSTKVDYPGLP